ncbi:MAG: threonine synthase, partial [Lachnospiraceae bacterium]|nr:threonine synthase [Lachnospiraceae bacterium]
MLYRSTRGSKILHTSAEAVLTGLAPDGGLFMPASLDWASFPVKDSMNDGVRALSARILSFFFDDLHDMEGIVERAYDGRFDTDELTPLAVLSDRYLLELFHGPTSAFKDVALSVLPQLLVQAKKETDDPNLTLILTATSGDTGKAALAGFRDVPGVKIAVFYPDGGVSPVQRLQMATQEGQNVAVAAIRGNFDDAQTGVKDIFARVSQEGLLDGRHAVLSSANSINIGRLVPQIMYYFKAYKDLLQAGRIAFGDPVDYTVPTGNFGDILAGYFAKKMGLPVRRLVCASNENNVLTDFLQTGVYDRNRPFYRTASPSMDILVSSNLERLLYLLSDENPGEVAEYMHSLNETGRYRVSG